MRTTEHTFSELLRKPNKIVQDLAEGDVVLRRRAAPDLRLSLVDRDEERINAYAMISRTLRNLALHSSATLTQSLADEFPWISLLPEADQKEFMNEFTRTASASAELDNFSALAQLIEEWRATAEIHSDPKLVPDLSRPITAVGTRVLPPSN